MGRDASPAGRAIFACVRLHALAFGSAIAPTLLAVGLVLAIILGGNGIPPRELVRLAHASALARLIAPLAWAVVVRSGTRALVFPPGAAWVRSAPLSRLTQHVVAAFFVVAAQAPLVGIAIAGADPPLGALLGLVAATVACAPRDRRGVALSLSSTALLVPALGAWATVASLGLAALALFALALRHAWSTAPLRARVRTLRLRRLPAIAQMMLAYARVSLRERPLVVVRAFVASALALLLAEHVRRMRAIDPWDRTSMLQLGVIVTVITAGPLVSPVGRTRRALRRWLRASPTPRVVAMVAAVLVVTTPALSFAAGFGATRARVETSASGLSAALGIALFCLALGAVLVRLEEWLHARRRDARFVFSLSTIALGALFVALAALPVVVRWAALALVFVLALVVPEPEVPFADDA